MKHRRLVCLFIASLLSVAGAAAPDAYPGMDTPPPAGTAAPLVDAYGQNAHADWPGKIRADADFAVRQKAELADLAAQPGRAEWNRYGGWADGPQFEATGFFRTKKHAGRWWLVDPAGRLFFSFGLNAVADHSRTLITERENLFPPLPARDGPLAVAWGSASNIFKGNLAGRAGTTFDFHVANLLRRHGPGPAAARAAADALVARRLRSWGFNTMGGWTPAARREVLATPYAIAVSYAAPGIEGAHLNWKKFPDPFHPAFLPALRKGFARAAGRSVGDPYCIGYFVDNELIWGDAGTLAAAALASPAAQPAKQAFLKRLRARYRDIGVLNAAWGTTHANFAALAAATTAPTTEAGQADLRDFTRVLMETYFATVRDFLREVAPRHLYLGPRFVHSWDLAGPAREIAARYCDVISFTSYTDTFAEVRLPEGLDRPLLIAEIGFGAADGRYYTGQLRWMKPVRTQPARAVKWQAWLAAALAHPAVVGMHWFCYADQPLTGRPFDGENFPFGFVDITDQPYPAMVAAQRAVTTGAYARRHNP